MAPEPQRNCSLIGTAGLLSGRTFTIGAVGLLIGRDPAACHVVLDDEQVSRVHSWVGFDELGNLIVRDRNSANGTYVNGVRIEERGLAPTDELAIGSGQVHRFRVDPSATTDTAPARPTTRVTESLPAPGDPLTYQAEDVEPLEATVLALPQITWKLTATAGPISGRTFVVGQGGLLVGRDVTQCHVVLADEEVSRVHAWVGFDELGKLIVRDRKSANGTFVNDMRVEERVLRSSDELAFGTHRQHLFRIEQVSGARLSATEIADESVPPRRATQVLGSQLSMEEVMALQGEETVLGGTVALKLTDLVARPHVELIVDKYAVKSLEVTEEGLTIGRDAGLCQIAIEHPSISGLHAEIRMADGETSIIDLSTNGTFVNGVRTQAKELIDGDYITFGRYAGKSLIFRTGLERQLKVESIDLTKDHIRIGRDSANDVVINHPVVSSHHAEIIKQDGRFIVVDLGSANGTFVNGIRIKRHELDELDRIVVGPSELRFSGQSLSHAPASNVIHLDARGISYAVADPIGGKPRLVLDDISLTVKPRELIGLLGPSGAGKSTLINVLNGFARPSGGAVFYNDADLHQNLHSLKASIGFVPQEDIMHRQLGVRRCLYYAARLRLPEDLSDEEINRRVDEMLEALKIEPQRWDNRVSTLSGGQRKRVSIGIELLRRPGVLFLDEPTAGLDPRTETLMMMLFRQLANQGSTIVISTHLLASFGVFDRVVVLLQGRLAFSGPGTKFLEYFEATVPADVYDDLTDNNTVRYALELKKRFESSELYEEPIAEPPPKPVTSSPRPAAAPPQTRVREKWFSLHQLRVLIRRNWELKFGDRTQVLLLFLQAPLVALLVGFMASAPNQIQTLFMAMFAALWFGCSNAVREIVDEQAIYKHERQTGLKILPYAFSKLFVLAFIALVQCTSVILILLFAGRALVLSPGEILAATTIMFLVAINGTMIGLVISALVSTPEKALTLFPLILIPELLLSGIFLPAMPVRTIVPITMDQLLEGRIFAPPDAEARLREMSRASNKTITIQAETESDGSTIAGGGGDTAHQVVSAVAPSEAVQKTFRRYTPQPAAGMPAFARMLSSLAVSRWGLEALSDLCVHGRHSIEDYAYKITNTISISLHPDDIEKLKAGLAAPPDAFVASGAFPLPSNPWKDNAPYMGILILHLLITTVAVLFLIKRKDVS